MKHNDTSQGVQLPPTRTNWRRVLKALGLAPVVALALVAMWSGSFVNSVRANVPGISAGASRVAPAGGLGAPVDNRPRVLLVPEQIATIQEAIDQAPDGSVIIVDPGEYRENLAIRGKKILLWAIAGAQQTFILGDGREGPIAVIADSQVAIEGFGFQNGRGETGRGLALERSHCSFTDCRITDNVGGVSATDSQADFDGCLIAWNRSSVAGGGVWASRSDVRLSDCDVEHNAAGTFGGGVYAANGSVRLHNVALRNNRVVSGAWGGGLYADGGNLDVIKCSIAGNSSEESGAGIYAFGVRARIRGTEFAGNLAASAFSVDGMHTEFDIQDSPLEGGDDAAASTDPGKPARVE